MSKSEKNGRGSKEAIAKRRAARSLNKVLTVEAEPTLDGRTAVRRKRLLKLLSEKRSTLKPIQVLTHVDALLEMGETIRSLKKLDVVCAPRPHTITVDIRRVVRNAQLAYDFNEEAWKVLGLPVDAGGTIRVEKRGRRKSR